MPSKSKPKTPPEEQPMPVSNGLNPLKTMGALFTTEPRIDEFLAEVNPSRARLPDKPRLADRFGAFQVPAAGKSFFAADFSSALDVTNASFRTFMRSSRDQPALLPYR